MTREEWLKTTRVEGDWDECHSRVIRRHFRGTRASQAQGSSQIWSNELLLRLSFNLKSNSFDLKINYYIVKKG